MARRLIEVDVSAPLSGKVLEVGHELGAMPKSIIFQAIPPGVRLSVNLTGTQFIVEEGAKLLDKDLSTIYLTTVGTSTAKLLLLVSDLPTPLYIPPATKVGQFLSDPATIGSLNDSEKAFLAVDEWRNLRIVRGKTDGVAVTSAARSTSSNNSGLEVHQWDELRFDLNITAVSGSSPTLDVYIEIKDLLTGNWIQQSVFPRQSAVLTEEISLVIPCIAWTYRVRWVIGGSTPSFTFSVAYHGKG